MREPLQGQVAVITGSSRGLGLAMAQACAAAGAAVVIASRSTDAVETAVAQVRAAGGRASGIACDVGNATEVEALRDHALATFGRLDLWVNNAGIAGVYGPTLAVPPAHFERVVRTNILGVYFGSFVAMQHFVAQNQGVLINLLGRGDKSPVPLQNAYGSSKAWNLHFTKALAREYRAHGVKVIGFNPGLVLTEMLSEVDAAPGYEEKVLALGTVARMWGNPPDVPARRLVKLAANAGRHPTGRIVHQLGLPRIVQGVAREGWQRLWGSPRPVLDIHVRTVRAAGGADGGAGG